MKRRKTFPRAAIATTLCAIIIGATLSWYVAGALVAPSPRPVADAPADIAATPVTLQSDSGSAIKGWHTKGESGKGVLVLLHGIRANRLAMLERTRWLDSIGYSTISIDFQAHGESPGERITVGHLEQHDVRAAVAFAHHEHPDEPVGVLGMSLGGAAALLASPLDIDALVLESVYTDIEGAVHNRVAARLGPLAPLPSALLLMQLGPRLGISPAQLRPIGHIAKTGCPTFILSGTDDVHTTQADTEALYAHAAEPKTLWLVEGAAHVDLLNYTPEEYRRRVEAFLEKHFQGPARGTGE
jgi:uncharacterized protein